MNYLAFREALMPYIPLVGSLIYGQNSLIRGLTPVNLYINGWLENAPEGKEQLELKNRVDKFAEEMGLKKNVEIYFGPCPQIAQAEGTSSFFGRSGIIADEAVLILDENAQNFIIKHEISHIQANDLVYLGAISAIAGIFAGYLSAMAMPVDGGITATLLAGAAAQYYYSGIREAAADMNALKHCSDEDKAAAALFFNCIKNAQQARKESLSRGTAWEKFKSYFITADGELRIDPAGHPPLSSRINLIVQSIADEQTRNDVKKQLNKDKPD